MLHQSTLRRLSAATAALILAAGSLLTTATFEADRPGAVLEPVGGASHLVQILQGNRTILWTTLAGPVAAYRVEGWPVTIRGNDLGGALVIESTGSASAGIVDLGERPRSLVFELNR